MKRLLKWLILCALGVLAALVGVITVEYLKGK